MKKKLTEKETEQLIFNTTILIASIVLLSLFASENIPFVKLFGLITGVLGIGYYEYLRLRPHTK